MADIDLSTKYILTNSLTGSSNALSSTSLNDSLIITPLKDGLHDDQLWFFTATKVKNRYRIHTVQKGEFYAIDISFYNPERTMTVHFVSVQDNTGQSWGIEKWEDGSFKIINDFSGPDMSLSADQKSMRVNMTGGDNPGQHWTLNRSDSMTKTSAGTTAATSFSVKATQTRRATNSSTSTSSFCAPSATACNAVAVNTKEQKLSSGAIAGASVGAIAGVVGLVAIAVLLWKKGFCIGRQNHRVPVVSKDG